MKSGRRKAKRGIAVVAIAAIPLLAFRFSLFAQLSHANRALAEGVPEVAAQKLREHLAQPLDEAERNATQLQLAETELAANQPETALEIVRAMEADADADFVKARSLAALGRWSEAEPIFRALAQTAPQPLADAARLCEAEALRALGRAGRAVAAAEAIEHPDTAAQLRLCGLYLDARQPKNCRRVLDRLTPANDAEQKWKRFLSARLLLDEGHAAPALVELQEIIGD